MYQVLFAEDELLVRLGLQNAVSWETYHMNLAAQADNGRDAYELFLKIRPEVVITDIKMKGMDGYELIQKIRAVDQKCAILVISCLDDFEMLRKMVSYHINGYILKASMTMEEINRELEKVSVYLKKEMEEGEEEERNGSPLEDGVKAYLFGDTGRQEYRKLKWKDGSMFRPEEIRSMILMRLEEDDRKKINDLGKHFISDLAETCFRTAVAVETDENRFCILTKLPLLEAEQKLSHMMKMTEIYLGITCRTVVKDSMGTTADLCARYGELLEKEGQEDEDPLIGKAVAYMKNHFRDSLSLKEISGMLGLSSSYFSHLFKKETGKNYVEYLNEIRMERVLWDLKNSTEKVAVIAERNGFHNLEYFSRFFKKTMGISPAKWRNQSRDEAYKLES